MMPFLPKDIESKCSLQSTVLAAYGNLQMAWSPRRQARAGHRVVSDVCGTAIHQRHTALWAEGEGSRHGYDGESVGQFEAMLRENALEHDLQLINCKGRPYAPPPNGRYSKGVYVCSRKRSGRKRSGSG